MAKAQSDWRIGLYECIVEGNNVVRKGRAVKQYYYGLYSQRFAESTILPDIKKAKRGGGDFEFPVLVVSWRLGKGDPPEPLPVPPGPGTLSIKKAGGLRKLRRIMGIPTQRKKVMRTEEWRAVIDEEGEVMEINDGRLKNVSP